ncbi:hypothetical protein [Flavobacterium sp. N1994]|uniref:hypothetical protein n=1 Tax=Flavobacterium sp. N1994 TaxID=2986827 RepID=UPI002221830A|nr:hypothetical protein [Flavobacterium sp. N1994]
MKKLLILLLLSGTVYSQNISKKEAINKNLCKAWVADYAMMGGLKVEKMGQMKSLTYTFKSDNTYLANGTISGKWQYNSKKKNIELLVNGVLKSTITSLEKKKIVMILNVDKSAPKEMGKLEIYFKPKG